MQAYDGGSLVSWEFVKFTLGLAGTMVMLLLSIIAFLVEMQITNLVRRIAALEDEAAKDRDFRVRAIAIYPELASGPD